MEDKLAVIEREYPGKVLDLQYAIRKLVAEIDRTFDSSKCWDDERNEISELQAGIDKIDEVTCTFMETQCRLRKYVDKQRPREIQLPNDQHENDIVLAYRTTLTGKE